MPAVGALRDSWICFLSGYRWDWFTSQTFRNPTHPEAADKVFRLWISMLNRHLFGPRWHRKGQSVWWVRALEWQKRNVLHFHALISYPEQHKDLNDFAHRLDWMDRWDQIAGYARIERPNSADAVTRYVTKYLVKEGDLECSPFLPSFTASGGLQLAKSRLDSGIFQAPVLPELLSTGWGVSRNGTGKSTPVPPLLDGTGVL